MPEAIPRRFCNRLRWAFVLPALVLGPSVVATFAQEVVIDNGPDRAQKQLVTIDLENTHLGYTYVGGGGVRYFVTEVSLANESGRLLSVSMDAFELRVDGHPYRPDIKHPQLTGYDFRVHGQSHRFRDLEQTKELPLSAGTTGSAWLVFTDLPGTPDVPRLELRLELEGVLHEIDINAYYDQQLKLQVERIGPHNALGLLTVKGMLNTISVGTLVETIDRLAAERLSRIVVTFGDDAAALDEPLGSWLRQTAQGIQTSRTYAMFPAVVSTVREFHVASIPGQPASSPAEHVHESTAAAVEAALQSAYRGLPPEDVVEQIERGHPLAQASALMSGGADLPAVYLPLLLGRADSKDPLLQRGALVALGGSGEPQAIQRLLDYAMGSDEQAATLAIECLAASRFREAHDQLAKQLDAASAIDPVMLVRILARYPRPQWAGYFSKLAAEDSGSSVVVRREAVMALGRVGHPELRRILSQTLESSDASLRETAFNQLLSDNNELSDQVALEYALKQLDRGPPTPQMLQLFDRVRDPRVAPRLTACLDDEERDRTAIINTLVRIGRASVDEELADRYDSFNPGEQAVVLANLIQLRSPRLLPLATDGLSSDEAAVFNGSVRALGLIATREAVDLLAERLDHESEVSRVSSLAKMLEDIGVPQAVRALEAVKNASQGDKRITIAKHLQSLRLKSPGGQHLRRAEQFVAEDEHAKAIEHYTLALQLDPDLAPAYSGRGHCHLKLDDYKQATDDFRRGIELDPDDGLAVAGLGIALAIEGHVDEAVKTVEEAEERFPQDLLFAYNAACVYGRVLEHVAKLPSSPDVDRQRKTYQQAAIDRLAKSLELGFDDRDWIKQDPDLASLRKLDDFQRLVAGPEHKSAPDENDGQPPARTPHEPREPDRQPAKPEPGEQ